VNNLIVRDKRKCFKRLNSKITYFSLTEHEM